MEATEERRVSKAVREATDAWCAEDPEQDVAERLVAGYRTSVLRKTAFIMACCLGAVVASGISLGIGTYHIGFLECYDIVWKHFIGEVEDTMLDFFVVEERLPRISLAILSGIGLAACGCVMQSLMKNPLADPYTTGISAGAGFGATLAMTAGITVLGGSYSLVWNAFLFALIPMMVIVGVSKIRDGSPTTMIMAGIAIMYIFNAFSTVFKLFADPDDLSALYKWQVGTMGAAGWGDITLIFVVVIAGFVFLQLEHPVYRRRERQSHGNQCGFHEKNPPRGHHTRSSMHSQLHRAYRIRRPGGTSYSKDIRRLRQQIPDTVIGCIRSGTAGHSGPHRPHDHFTGHPRSGCDNGLHRWARVPVPDCSLEKIDMVIS